MFNPPAPCEILREEVLPQLNVSIKEFAEHIGYSREAVSRVLHCKTPITPQFALCLEQAGVSTAEMWLKLQAKYDLWQLRQQKPQRQIIQFTQPAFA